MLLLEIDVIAGTHDLGKKQKIIGLIVPDLLTESRYVLERNRIHPEAVPPSERREIGERLQVKREILGDYRTGGKSGRDYAGLFVGDAKGGDALRTPRQLPLKGFFTSSTSCFLNSEVSAARSETKSRNFDDF